MYKFKSTKATSDKIIIKTSTRDELIDASRVLANAIEPKFFQNKDDIPGIFVSGTCSGGKSLIIEAMMKQLLDEYDASEMKHPDAPRQMFIEDEPCDALNQYCQAIGHCLEKPVLFGFDRISTSYDDKEFNNITENFRKAVESHKRPVAGAIFSSWFGNPTDKKSLWLKIGLNRSEDDRGNLLEWGRELTITINKGELHESPRFQRVKELLRNSAEQDYAMLADRSTFVMLPLHAFFNNKAKTEDHVKALNAMDALKFAFYNPKQVQISHKDLCKDVANMANFGETALADQFSSWLEDIGEVELAKTVEAERSSLKRIFNMLTNWKQSKFDFEGFLQCFKNSVLLRPGHADSLPELAAAMSDMLGTGNASRRENGLTVLTNLLTDRDLSQMLKAGTGRHSLMNEMASQNAQNVLNQLYNELNPEQFPQSRQRLERFLLAADQNNKKILQLG